MRRIKDLSITIPWTISFLGTIIIGVVAGFDVRAEGETLANAIFVGFLVVTFIGLALAFCSIMCLMRIKLAKQ